MPLLLAILPEGAIIRPSDTPADRPDKARISGVNSALVSLDFPEGTSAKAVWRLLIPPQTEMGTLDSDDLVVRLRYTAKAVASGDVGWEVAAYLLDIGDPAGDVTGATVTDSNNSSNLTYSGAAYDEQENTVTIAGFFTGIDTSKAYTLILKITRRTVSGDLGGEVSLLPSYAVVSSGKGAGFDRSNSYSSDTTLTASNIRNTLLIGDTSSGDVDLTLPSLTSVDDLLPFTVVREGTDRLRLLSPDPAYRIVSPNYVSDQTYELNSDGDSASLVYVHAVQTYYVIG